MTAPRISSWAARTSVSMSRLTPNSRRVRRTTHWIAKITGPRTRTTSSIGPETERATSSARTMANVLGSTSTNTTTSTVMTPVAMATPQAPGTSRVMNSVARDGGEDVEDVVADQHGADHGLLIAQKPVDPPRAAIAIAFELVHPAAAGSGQSGLGRREHRRYRQQRHDAQADQRDRRDHVTAPSACRKASRRCSSTSRATKASPIARARIRVTPPSLAFLSCLM